MAAQSTSPPEPGEPSEPPLSRQGRPRTTTPPWGDEPTLLGPPRPEVPAATSTAASPGVVDLVSRGNPGASSRALVIGVLSLVLLPVLLVASAVTGHGPSPASAAAPVTVQGPSSASPSAPPPPTTAPEITLPAVAGRNGAIILAELKALGLTEVTFRSTGEFGAPVLLAQNWTGVSIEPAVGTVVTPGETVVVTVRRTT